MKIYGFSKKEKIKSRILLNTVFKEGKAFYSKTIKILFIPNDITQVAVIVNKRFVPLSVNRNKMKRIIREAYRLNKYILKKTCSIIIMYKQYKLSDFKHISEDVKCGLKFIESYDKL